MMNRSAASLYSAPSSFQSVLTDPQMKYMDIEKLVKSEQNDSIADSRLESTKLTNGGRTNDQRADRRTAPVSKPTLNNFANSAEPASNSFPKSFPFHVNSILQMNSNGADSTMINQTGSMNSQNELDNDSQYRDKMFRVQCLKDICESSKRSESIDRLSIGLYGSSGSLNEPSSMPIRPRIDRPGIASKLDANKDLSKENHLNFSNVNSNASSEEHLNQKSSLALPSGSQLGSPLSSSFLPYYSHSAFNPLNNHHFSNQLGTTLNGTGNLNGTLNGALNSGILSDPNGLTNGNGPNKSSLKKEAPHNSPLANKYSSPFIGHNLLADSSPLDRLQLQNALAGLNSSANSNFNSIDVLNSVALSPNSASLSSASSALNAFRLTDGKNIHSSLNGKTNDQYKLLNGQRNGSAHNRTSTPNSLASPITEYQISSALSSLNQQFHRQFDGRFSQFEQYYTKNYADSMSHNGHCDSSPNLNTSNSLSSSLNDDGSTADGMLSSSQLKQRDCSNQKHIKKPLNAFMLFMRDYRPRLLSQSNMKESALINQQLGKMVGLFF